MKKNRSAAFYYCILFFVIIIWGLDPTVYAFLYRYYSAAVLCAICTLASFLLFLVISGKRLKQINIHYIIPAVTIGMLNSVASLLQRIGLQYTTPAKYAFLEHLSCVVIPVAMFLLTKKKPRCLQIFASILCLAGCFALSGAGTERGIQPGDYLCALSGILYGIVIAAIGIYTRKLDNTLYMTLYMVVYFLVSVFTSILLNRVAPEGVPLEPAIFTPNAVLVAAAALFGLISVGICWLLRAEAIKHLNPTTVGVLSPLTAIIAATVSVISGTDRLSWNMGAGARLVTAAAVLCAIADAREAKNSA